jgi:hypothetical protein
MTTPIRLAHIIGLAALLGVVAITSDAQASSKVITFKVPVKLQNVDPSMHSASVHCAMLYAPGGGVVAGMFGNVNLPLTAGAYSGTVSVPVTVDTSKLKAKNPWTCMLLLNPGAGWVTGENNVPALAATIEALKPKPGTLFVGELTGTLP